MKRERLAYFLIGLGIGLILSAVAILEFAWSFHHMFIIGIFWLPATIVIATPLFFIAVGGFLLLRHGKPRISNRCIP
jgi:hypothetical protein